MRDSPSRSWLPTSRGFNHTVWYAIGILFLVFVMIGLMHSHNAKVEPPRNTDEHDDEYIQRIYTDNSRDRVN